MIDMATATRLADGWDELTADDDTMLRRFVHHHAAAGAIFVAAGGGRVASLPGMELADLGRPAGYWNSVVLTRPPDDWEAVTETIRQETRGGTGEVAVLSPFPTPDLTSSGFVLSGHPPLLIRPPIAMVPIADGTARIGPALDEVTTADDLVEWERVVVEGYPIPAMTPFEPGTLAAPAILDDDRVRCWLGRHDGRPVSASAHVASHGIASLALGVTRPDARGLGHWRAHAITRMRTRPDLWHTGIFSDFSRPLAEALGFMPLCRLTLWMLPR